LPAKADLAIILGTSLTVQPFASLPSFVREDTPRVLINLEKVGGLGSRPDDVLMLGDCDTGVRKFADALGWRDELEELWETTNPTKGERKQQEVPKSRQEALDDEIEKLTKDIDDSLKLTGEANERMKAELQNNTPPNNAVPNPSSSPTDVLTTQVNTSNEESNLAHVFPHLKEEKRGKSSL
jgi:NAD-dependent histone deacetylase SIR2